MHVPPRDEGHETTRSPLNLATVRIALSLAALAAAPGIVKAAPPPTPVSARAPRAETPRAGVTMAWENDAFASTDRHYTNGLRIALQLPAPSSFASWAARGRRTCDVGLVVGQQMFTPEDVRSSSRVLDDRPYAGWLYAGIVLRMRGGGPWDEPDSRPVLDTFEVDVGVLGAWSAAESTQRFVHKVTGGKQSAGWKHQAREAPALQLSWLRQVRAARVHLPLALELDVTPHVGVAAGSFMCAVRAGATVRVGRGIPPDFGGMDDDALPLPIPIGEVPAPRPAFGAWLVVRGDARASFFDASLDGTPFRDDVLHVRRELLVGSLEVGVMFSFFERVLLGYTHTIRTPEFIGQGGPDMFGALTLHVAF